MRPVPACAGALNQSRLHFDRCRRSQRLQWRCAGDGIRHHEAADGRYGKIDCRRFRRDDHNLRDRRLLLVGRLQGFSAIGLGGAAIGSRNAGMASSSSGGNRLTGVSARLAPVRPTIKNKRQMEFTQASLRASSRLDSGRQCLASSDLKRGTGGKFALSVFDFHLSEKSNRVACCSQATRRQGYLLKRITQCSIKAPARAELQRRPPRFPSRPGAHRFRPAR